MFKEKNLLLVSLCYCLSLSIVFSALPFSVKKLSAEDAVPVYIGEAVAMGKAFLVPGSGQRLSLDSSPYPIFENSTVQTGQGVAVIYFVPDGLVPNGRVEVHKGSEVLLVKKAGKNTLELKTGVIRFSIPSNISISVITPSAEIIIGGPPRLAGTGVSVLLGKEERVGVVGIDEGKVTYVGSTKGSLDVIVGGINTLVLRPGDTIMVAQADAGARQRLSKSQLSALAAQEGVRVISSGERVAPSLMAGEVALPLPGGYFFVVGTPEAIAAGLNAVGVTATASDVRAAAIAEGVLNLTSLTRQQLTDVLSSIYAREGVRVVATGIKKIPRHGPDEVVLPIPEGIGGGFIVGTPEDIAAALTAAGTHATATAVINAAIKEEEEEDKGGFAWWWVGAGLLAVGSVAALAGGGGGSGGGVPASPPGP